MVNALSSLEGVLGFSSGALTSYIALNFKPSDSFCSAAEFSHLNAQTKSLVLNELSKKIYLVGISIILGVGYAYMCFALKDYQLANFTEIFQATPSVGFWLVSFFYSHFAFRNHSLEDIGVYPMSGSLDFSYFVMVPLILLSLTQSEKGWDFINYAGFVRMFVHFFDLLALKSAYARADTVHPEIQAIVVQVSAGVQGSPAA